MAIEVYKVTKDFPGAERYGLVSQLRRCSVSIPSNIAEGYRRGRKEYEEVSKLLGAMIRKMDGVK